jgi:hypothetical protein
LEELLRQYEQQNIGPLLLKVDARFTPVCTPDEVSKALINALETRKIQSVMGYVSTSRPLLSSISINAGLVTISLGELFTKLSGREVNLESTINKFDKILDFLKPLPRKPVIVIGTMQTYAEKRTSNPEFSATLLIFF